MKTMEELWFPPSNTLPGTKTQAQMDQERNRILSKVSVIMGVCGNFKDRQSPLEDMLNKLVSGRDGADLSALQRQYGEVCDAMIDGLVDASDFMNFVSSSECSTDSLLTNIDRRSSIASERSISSHRHTHQ